MPERVMVFNVDKSHTIYRGSRITGDLPPSERSKFHLDRGDTTAKCSQRVLLNSMPGDVGEWLDRMDRDSVCRRCVPLMPEPYPDCPHEPHDPLDCPGDGPEDHRPSVQEHDHTDGGL